MVWGMVALTIIGIMLIGYVFKTGFLSGLWIWLFRIVGGLLIILFVFVAYPRE